MNMIKNLFTRSETSKSENAGEAGKRLANDQKRNRVDQLAENIGDGVTLESQDKVVTCMVNKKKQTTKIVAKRDIVGKQGVTVTFTVEYMPGKEVDSNGPTYLKFVATEEESDNYPIPNADFSNTFGQIKQIHAAITEESK